MLMLAGPSHCCRCLHGIHSFTAIVRPQLMRMSLEVQPPTLNQIRLEVHGILSNELREHAYFQIDACFAINNILFCFLVFLFSILQTSALS